MEKIQVEVRIQSNQNSFPSLVGIQMVPQLWKSIAVS